MAATVDVSLDRARMHLIALALTHLNEISPDLGIFLVSGSVRAVTEHILGHCPTGIKRTWAFNPALTRSNIDHRTFR